VVNEKRERVALLVRERSHGSVEEKQHPTTITGIDRSLATLSEGRWMIIARRSVQRFKSGKTQWCILNFELGKEAVRVGTALNFCPLPILLFPFLDKFFSITLVSWFGRR